MFLCLFRNPLLKTWCILDGERFWGGRPPAAGGRPTKYHQLAFRSWYRVTRRTPKGHGTWVPDLPYPPLRGGRGGKEWEDVIGGGTF